MTILQARAIKNIVEGHGNVTQAMLKAGYSKASVNNPDVLTNSNAWKQVMGKYLPDDKLFRKHEEALDATKHNEFTGELSPDHAIRLKAIDMAYKLKGRGNDNVSTNNTQINIALNGDGYIPPNNVLGLKPTLSHKPTTKPTTTVQTTNATPSK